MAMPQRDNAIEEKGLKRHNPLRKILKKKYPEMGYAD